MSRYVTRASKQAPKIGSLKRGSQAFSTASGLVALDQLEQIAAFGGVHALGREPIGLAQSRDHLARALGRDVGHRHPLERVAPLGDRGERRPHAASTNDEHSHGEQSCANPLTGTS